MNLYLIPDWPKAGLIVLALYACGASTPAQHAKSASHPQSTAPVSETPAGAAAHVCVPVGAVETIVAAGATVIIGEVHGTAEAPRFSGDVACHAARHSKVLLALEIPRDEQPRIDRYLASAGSAADQRALLAGPFWTRVDQDGRSSQAMLALLDRARQAAYAVLAFDVPSGAATDGSRDREMAKTVAKARVAAPDHTLIVLTGNYHSRRTVGAPWDPNAVFMAHHLAADGVSFHTLDLQPHGGGAWVCTMNDQTAMSCGPQSAPATTPPRSWYIELGDDATGHDGYYIVGPTTASPPALAR